MIPASQVGSSSHVKRPPSSALHVLQGDAQAPEKGKAREPLGSGPPGVASSGPGPGGQQTLAQGSDDVQLAALRKQVALRLASCPPPAPSGSGAPAGLRFTPGQLLSHHVEKRRRALLITTLNLWKFRLYQAEWRAAGLADLRAALDAGQGDIWPGSRWAGAAAQALDVELAAREARQAALNAAKRVRSLSSDLAPRAGACGTLEGPDGKAANPDRRRWLSCRCDGGPRSFPEECRQRYICEGCRKLAARRLRRRVTEAVYRHSEAYRDERGRAAPLRLITLTLSDSGDLAADRADLYRGWLALRKHLHRVFGYAVPFVLVWEVTLGTHGRGHLHAHVLVVGGPRKWDGGAHYGRLRKVWGKACPRSRQMDIRWCGSIAKSAHYITKYIAKGSAVMHDEKTGECCSDELIAQLLAATYNKRACWTSLHFWSPPDRRCKCCGWWFRPVKGPDVYGRALDRAGVQRPELPLECRVVDEREVSIASAMEALGATYSKEQGI